MTKYAMLYRERYIPLTRSGTIEQAQEVALEYLWELGCDGDDNFEIIEVVGEKEYSVRDFDSWFEQRLKK
jgi:hypothetical protein